MDDIRTLYPRSAKHLLWDVFLRDDMQGVKLWLSKGYGATEMPLPMLFFAYQSGLIGKSIVLERMKYAHSNLMFLPEQIEMGHDVDNCYSGICTDEIFRALRIIRCRHVVQEDQIKSLTKRHSHYFSRLIRTQGAILSDDKGWLGALATEPGFEFSSDELVFAARYGSIDCFRFISINGAEYEQRVLEAAVYGGNEEIIQMCLEHGCDVRTDEVMMQSARGCQTKVLEWLIDVHEMQPTADVVVTALMGGNYDVVVRFSSVLHECDTISFDQWGDSVLPRNDDFRHFVVHLLDDPCVHTDLKTSIIGNEDAILYCDDVELAKKCGVDINYFGPILFAAQNACDRILVAISENGKIDDTNSFGDTALIACVRYNDVHCISTLVEHGANMEVANEEGWNALMIAAFSYDTATVKCLVEHGANEETVDKDGRTALMLAARYGCTDTVEYLVEHGANVEAVDQDGRTALVHASYNGCTDTVEYLVEHGANVEAVDTDGSNALMLAAWNVHTDTVEYLVEHGANVEAVDKDGRTALRLAARYGCTDTVEYLVEHGANAEAVDKAGRTALMHAAYKGHTDTVKYLVEHGANVEAVDKDGRTALRLAEINLHTDTAKYLVEYGASDHPK